MADKIVMGYWDCTSCGSKGIPGTTYDCPNCGRQRGKETRFYMKEGPVEYVAGHKVTGADWYCEYCGALNTADRTNCENCGSPKSDSKDDYFTLKDKQKPQSTANIVSDNNSGSRSFMDTLKNVPQKVWVILGIILLIIFGNMIASKIASAPHNYTFDVQDVTWENSIDIEEYKTFRESDWYVPDGGRLAYTNQEVRSYRSVLDHYEQVTKSRRVESGGHYETDYTDNGDGTFTEHSTYVPDYTTEYYTEDEPVYRQEPIYDTKYYYDIDRWVFEKTETTAGSDKNPYWPALNLNDKERESNRSSKYQMSGILHYKSFGKNKEKTETYDIQESWWKEIETGQTLDITIENGKLTEWSK